MESGPREDLKHAKWDLFYGEASGENMNMVNMIHLNGKRPS